MKAKILLELYEHLKINYPLDCERFTKDMINTLKIDQFNEEIQDILDEVKE